VAVALDRRAGRAALPTAVRDALVRVRAGQAEPAAVAPGGLVASGDAAAAVEPAAELKLRHAGLTGRFGFGGYGSDARDRAALVAIAIERARAIAPHHTEVVVVGDTIHDIAAARACGATVCAVTTGSDPREALLTADAVFDSMEELMPWHRAPFGAPGHPSNGAGRARRWFAKQRCHVTGSCSAVSGALNASGDPVKSPPALIFDGGPASVAGKICSVR
jgi:HAD-hyrolase-like